MLPGSMHARQSCLEILTRMHDKITLGGAWLSAIALSLMVAAYVLEVVSRYVFNAPTSWATEGVNYLLCAMIFLLLPELTRRRANIAITFLLEKIQSPRALFLLGRLIAGLGFAVCLATAYVSLDANVTQFSEGIETQAALPIPKWLVSVFITYGFASASLYFLRQAIVEKSLPVGGSMDDK